MKSYLVVAASAILALASVARAATPDASLYERLGGEPVMIRVIEQTTGRMVDDPAVNQSFDGVNLKKLRAKILMHFCALTGGGCVYTGDDMKTTHEGLEIGQREFYAMVEALRISLDSNGVGEREKNELLRLLAPMKRDVVTR